MAQLMLINPAKRPSKRRKATPAQLRALAKARRARAGLSTNPASRKRRAPMRAVARATRRRARHNPIGMGGIMGNVVNAVQGAAGALAVNAVFRLLPLPLSMTTGTMAPAAVKMALAVGVGMLGKPVLGRFAGRMAEGAMTVAAYEAIAGMVPASFGGSAPAGVAGLGYMSPAMNAGATPALTNQSLQGFAGVGEYVSGMGEYVY